MTETSDRWFTFVYCVSKTRLCTNIIFKGATSSEVLLRLYATSSKVRLGLYAASPEVRLELYATSPEVRLELHAAECIKTAKPVIKLLIIIY